MHITTLGAETAGLAFTHLCSIACPHTCTQCKTASHISPPQNNVMYVMYYTCTLYACMTHCPALTYVIWLMHIEFSAQLCFCPCCFFMAACCSVLYVEIIRCCRCPLCSTVYTVQTVGQGTVHAGGCTCI